MTTTTARTQSPSTTTSRHSIRGLAVGSILLLAAIAAVLVVLIQGALTSTDGTSSSGDGHDNFDCRPTSVVHYC
jgi:hypothetical protein